MIRVLLMTGLEQSYFLKNVFFSPTRCFILPSQHCFLTAYTGSVFQMASHTLLSYSIFPSGERVYRELKHFFNSQKSPNSKFVASWMENMGSLGNNLSREAEAGSSVFSHPAPSTPRWPEPHCLWLLGCSFQLMEKHVAI